jgi:ABC-type glycerol-3-phosphate transport system permease component
MDGIVDTLRLGWNALLLRDEAYEEMRIDPNPVVKGLILIVVVGVVIALLGLVGDVLEWASTPNLNQIRDTVLGYLPRMPWWEEASRDPDFTRFFDQMWNWNWNMATWFSPSPGGAAINIVLTPLALVIRWLIYGLLAYVFARWLGGTGDLSATLGVLALAVAPQALNVLRVFPYVELGSLVSIWGILCAYVGLKTAHKLYWYRAMWATLLPFILVIVVGILAGCFGTAIFAALVRGG